MKETYRLEYLERPGKYWSKNQADAFVEELRNVAATCFDEVPLYQVLSGKREDLEKVVVVTARNSEGRIQAFCSSVLLDVENVGTVLHLGLTCVHPEARGGGFTKRLLSKLLGSYLMANAPLRGTYVSNVACVLSSLGNVAMHFEDIYPSPFVKSKPSAEQLAIAKAISDNYRDEIAINDNAQFDGDAFVFRGSVKNTPFQKSADDRRYFHRDPELTNYYRDIMNFDEGDEVLQVGKVSLFSFPKFVAKSIGLKTQRSIEVLKEKFAQPTA
jgi:GNAT superfamily N-acetyltransferase